MRLGYNAPVHSLLLLMLVCAPGLKDGELQIPPANQASELLVSPDGKLGVWLYRHPSGMHTNIGTFRTDKNRTWSAQPSGVVDKALLLSSRRLLVEHHKRKGSTVELRLLRPKTGKTIARTRRAERVFTASADGRLILGVAARPRGGGASPLLILSGKTLKVRHTIRDHGLTPLKSASFSIDRKKLVLMGTKSLLIYETRRWKVIARHPIVHGRSIELSADGRAAIAHRDHVVFRDLDTWKQVARAPLKAYGSVRRDPKGEVFAVIHGKLTDVFDSSGTHLQRFEFNRRGVRNGQKWVLLSSPPRLVDRAKTRRLLRATGAKIACVGDCVNGEGVLTDDTGRWDGSFHKGLFTGAGKWTDPSGTVYKGFFVNGELHTSRGFVTTKARDAFDGEYRRGRPVRGKLRFANGDVYAGKFAGGLPSDTKGRLERADGTVWVGPMRKGQAHGTGTYCAKSGRCVPAEMVNGRFKREIRPKVTRRTKVKTTRRTRTRSQRPCQICYGSGFVSGGTRREKVYAYSLILAGDRNWGGNASHYRTDTGRTRTVENPAARCGRCRGTGYE